MFIYVFRNSDFLSARVVQKRHKTPDSLIPQHLSFAVGVAAVAVESPELLVASVPHLIVAAPAGAETAGRWPARQHLLIVVQAGSRRCTVAVS